MKSADARAIVADVERALTEQTLPGRAEYEKKYLKSELRFIGVAMSSVRAECARLYKSHKALDRRSLDVITSTLWKSDCHELRSVAICLMIRFADRYTSDDLPGIKTLISQSAGWAHVDWLSIDLLGSVYSRDAYTSKQLRKWAKDDDFWVRRASMLALLDEARAGNRKAFDLFCEFASMMIAEREFFIRKAIGWILREVSKKQPEWSFEFLSKHKDGLSGLTMREGSKYLPQQMLEQLKR